MPDEAFCDWLAGFVDAEGCLRIDRSSPMLAIKLRSDDKTVLKMIRETLGFGAIYNASQAVARANGVNRQDQCVYQADGRKNALRLVEILDGRMHAKKRRDFEIWKAATLASNAIVSRCSPERKIMMQKFNEELVAVRAFDSGVDASQHVHDISPDWIAGFVDGESSMMIAKNGAPRFCLNLRSDDSPILLAMQDYFGVGSVTYRGNAGSGAATYLAFSANCLPIITALDGRLRTKKANDFELFKEAVVHHTSYGPNRQYKGRKAIMLDYKKQLEEVRKA